jgi:hypothetical protein
MDTFLLKIIMNFEPIRLYLIWYSIYALISAICLSQEFFIYLLEVINAFYRIFTNQNMQLLSRLNNEKSRRVSFR